MKWILPACVAVAAVCGVATTSAEAGGRYDYSGYGGWGSRSHYSSPYSSEYSPRSSWGFNRGYGYDAHRRSRSHWHDTTHLDYHPGYFQRHYDHYDYVPGHYHLHRSGHWDRH